MSQIFIVSNAVYSYILSFAQNNQGYNSLRNYNVDASVSYWVMNEENVRATCENIVFDILCLIDGVSAESNFTTVDINVELPPNYEFHSAWCEFLNNKK